MNPKEKQTWKESESRSSSSPCVLCRISKTCHRKCTVWCDWWGERWKSTRKLFGAKPCKAAKPKQVTFAQRLRCAREKAGMTQKELAMRVGVAVMTISSYETGKTRPSPIILQHLTDVLGTTIEKLR